MKHLFLLVRMLVITASSFAQISYQQLYTNQSFAQKTVDDTKPVGSIEGVASVSGTGAATYIVPIWCPPGTNGMQPSVALAYSSQSGSGIMGTGWSLSGLSAITRVNRDIYHDGAVSAVDYTFNDRYALDGTRLVLKSGSYGAANAEYAPEAEDFSHIVSYGSKGNGPESFFVRKKDGTLLQYGNTTDSRFLTEDNQHVMKWLLNKIIDIHGNFIEFEYTLTNREPRIHEIRYTGNIYSGLSPYNKISFEYAERMDKNKGYESGSYVYSSLLLNKIKVHDENSVVQKTYELTYGHDGINSFLKELTEKDRNGNGLNATAFQYGDFSNNINSNSISGLPGPAGSTPLIPDVLSGDFNGDGISEMVFVNKVTHPQLGVYDNEVAIYQKNSANGFTAGPSIPFSQPTYVEIRKRVGYAGDYTTLTQSDFNGDGLQDILTNKVDVSGINTVVRLQEIKIHYGDRNTMLNSNAPPITPTTNWNGSNINACDLSKEHTPTLVGDFDGNGKTDMFIIGEGTPGNHFPFIYEAGTTPFAVTGIDFNQMTHSFEMRQVDFDGDGKTDILFLDQDYCYIYTFIKQPNGTYAATKLLDHAGYPNLWHKVWTGDFNGDGKTDVLTFVAGYNWSWGISTGKTFAQTFLPVIAEEFHDACKNTCGGGLSTIHVDEKGDDLIVGDYNGDGRSDILFSNTGCPCSGSGYTVNTNIDLYLSGNQNLQKVSNYYSASEIIPGRTITVADIYGTGKQQLMFRFANAQSFTNLSVKGTQFPMVKVSDGFANVNMFSYEPLSTSSHYTKGSSASYPLVDLQAPLYVVTSHQVPDGLGTHNTTSYTYDEAVGHLAGRGFLGFKKWTSETPALNTKTEAFAEIDQNHYVPYATETKVHSISPAQQISGSINDILFAQGTVSGTFYQQLLEQTEQNLLTGSSNKIINTYDPNNFGTIVSSTTDINGIETIITNTDYIQPGSATIPCFPDLVTINRQRSGQGTTTDKVKYTYDWAGRISQKITRYQTSYYISANYQYDAFGNLIQQDEFSPIVSAPNPNIISNYYAYDSKGRFPVSATNQLSQTSYATWDAIWGQPLSKTGIDGVTTSSTYDTWGRVVTAKLKTGTVAEETITNSYGWDNGGDQHYILNSHPGKPDVKTWYDKLGREVKTQTEHLNGQWTESTKTYDSKGYLVAATTAKLSSEPAFTTNYAYNDLYNRLTSVTDNFGTTLSSYSFLGNGETKVTVTNAAGQSQSTTTDATGKTIKQEDHGGELLYTYDSRGNLLTVRQWLNTLMIHSYNAVGIKTATWDASAGSTAYTYDAFGRLKSMKTPNSHTYNYRYNELGQMTQRTGPEGTTYYYYHGAGSGLANQLASVVGFNGVDENYTYDNLGRLISKDKTINGTIYTTSYTYDNLDQIIKKQYSDGFYLQYDYNNSYLTTVKNSLRYTNHLLFHSPTLNGKGQYSQYTLGNKVTTNTYHHGYLTRTTTPGIQDLEMNYHYATGNLNYREDHVKGLKETFSYDNLNRLTQSQVGSNGAFTFGYDINGGGQSRGTIVNKTDIGTFGISVNARTYSAYNQQTQISQQQQDLTYAPFRKTETVTENGYDQSFTYDAAYNRVMTTVSDGGNLELQRLYVDDYEITTDYTTGEERIIHYLYGGDGLFGIAEINPHSVNAFPFNINYHYLYKDHLGSIVAATDMAQNVIEEERNFDAWGRERDPLSWQHAGATPVGLSNNYIWLYRGYTGHEHMPHFSMVNMNGRMYDPLLARMMSPDPYIMPAGTQGYNRYTYALNNPLKYTDPDGEWVQFVFGAVMGGISGWQIAKANGAKGAEMWKYIGIGAGIGLATAGAGTGVSAMGGGAILAGAASGAVAGAGFAGLQSKWDAGAMAKGAVFGGITGTISGGVGAAVGGGWGAFAAGATSGGLGTLMNGGNIGQSFVNSVVGGGLGWGLYHAGSYVNWKYRGGSKWGDLDVSYEQYLGMQSDYIKARFYRREYGGYLMPDGSYQRWAGSGKHHFRIEGVTLQYDANGNTIPMYHTHWAKPGGIYYTLNDKMVGPVNGATILEATRYFSPDDLQGGNSLPGPSLMLNRFDGAYGNQNTYNQTGSSSIAIDPPISRFYNYLSIFW